MNRLRWVLWLCPLCWLSLSASAQDGRELHWDQLAVNAHLAADGSLHVSERHDLVFTGDWNGGERRFRVEPWQSLRGLLITQIGPSGSTSTLTAGELDNVGEYKWFEGNTLRWRSRLPSDPPFANTRLTYELAYVLGGVLLPQGTDYVLNHDFAFADRTGVIKRFTLTLTADPAWRLADPDDAAGGASADGETLFQSVPGQYAELEPGSSVVIRRVLHHEGSAPLDVADPNAMPSTTHAPQWRQGLAAVLLLFVLLCGAAFLSREQRLGRFQPGLAAAAIDANWLREHVFGMRPETVGAAWKLNVTAQEVGAVLARMAAAGKISSTVEQGGTFGRRQVLHLTLLVDRDSLQGYDAALVKALFFDHRTTTDTDAVAAHYSSKGFDPVQMLAPAIKQQLPALFADRVKPPRMAWAITLLAVLGGCALLVGAAIQCPAPPVFLVSAVVLLVQMPLYFIGTAAGRAYRNRPENLALPALFFTISVAALIAIPGYVLLGGSVESTLLQQLALIVWTLGLLNSLFNAIRSRETRETLQLRRWLAAARRFFLLQLQRPAPDLQDDWVPYLIAFGLGPKMDRWSRTFGAAADADSPSDAGATGSFSRSGGSSSTPGGWSGGGGKFGGAGASGSWAAAVGGMAAGVASPSSSSSSSGSSSSSSSSSSGGGGGGGW